MTILKVHVEVEKNISNVVESSIKSVRKFKGEKTPCLNITPLSHLGLSKSTFRYNENRTNEYLTFLHTIQLLKRP